jgi:putative FmdB family regulatory protein
MPIYEFSCNKCSAKVEKILSIAEAEKLDKNPEKCEYCSVGKLVKIEYSQSTFRLIGKWYKQGY